ncbi:MAG: bis(5'-nucleosyl)-tetraphosphatase (symmetrical) YqeK [Clostridiaceae bacterium]
MGLLNELKKYLKYNLDDKRYKHVLGVRKTAEELALTHMKFKNKTQRDEFIKSVAIAALAHDIDKGKDPEDLYKILKKEKIPELKIIKSSPEVYHAFSGAVKARETFNIKDEDVLNAIRYHTTGRAGMSDLEKIIYLSDYIEPGRSFSGLDKIRKMSQKDLDKDCILAFDSVIDHL